MYLKFQIINQYFDYRKCIFIYQTFSEYKIQFEFHDI